MNLLAPPWSVKMAIGGLVAGIATLSAFATVGWARHGEQIFVRMLDAGWMTCF
jgi:hypothetical protein